MRDKLGPQAVLFGLRSQDEPADLFVPLEPCGPCDAHGITPGMNPVAGSAQWLIQSDKNCAGRLDLDNGGNAIFWGSVSVYGNSVMY